MKIYILTYRDYDFYDGYSERVIGIFTKEALDRELEKMVDKEMKIIMEDYFEDYQQEMKIALAEKERVKDEVKRLCYQMQSMNEFINEAKHNNDEATYRVLVRERKKLGRKVNQITRHAQEKIDKIESEYKRIEKNIRDNYIVEEMNLIE